MEILIGTGKVIGTISRDTLTGWDNRIEQLREDIHELMFEIGATFNAQSEEVQKSQFAVRTVEQLDEVHSILCSML